jgi:hypothetical protein
MAIDPGTLDVTFEVSRPALSPRAAVLLLRILRRELSRQATDAPTGPELDNHEVLAS